MTGSAGGVLAPLYPLAARVRASPPPEGREKIASRPASIIALAATLLLLAQAAWAAPRYSVSARFDRAQAVVGEGLFLTIEVRAGGAQMPEAEPEFPPDFHKYFSVGGTSSSFQTTFVNGVAGAQRQITYELRPLRAGRVLLAPVQVKLAGGFYVSEPLQVDVLAAQPRPGGGPAGRAPRYFAEALVAPPGPLYPGQELKFSIVVYSQDSIDGSSFPNLTLPDIPKFRVEMPPAASRPQFSLVERGGARYFSAPVLRAVLYPIVSGVHLIPPLTLQFPVQSSGGGGGGDPLNRFFGGAFGGVQQMRVQTNGVEVRVASLPEKDRPADFRGAVGELSAAARLGRDRVETGGTVPYVLEISGLGNAEGVLAPALSLPAGWESFDAQVSTDTQPTPEGGIRFFKRFTFLLIPRRPGPQAIAPASYSWFDPKERRYAAWQAPEAQILVTGEAAEGPRAAGAAPQAAGAQGPELRYIKPDASELLPARSEPWERAWFWALALLPVGACGASFALASRRGPGARGSPQARRQAASRRFRKALRQAARETGAAARAAPASRAVLEFLSGFWGFEAAGMTQAQLEERLREAGLPADACAALREFLESADAVRFAGGRAPEDMLDRARALARRVEEGAA